jgi:hypothetical protein
MSSNRGADLDLLLEGAGAAHRDLRLLGLLFGHRDLLRFQ